MADPMRLGPPVEWGFDPDTNEILLRLRQAAPEGTDPAENWQPSQEAVIRCAVVSVNVKPLRAGTAVLAGIGETTATGELG
jgi:hypothetical protein